MASAEVIVVGLGAMGAAVAWQLAERGARVLGLDRFAPPHDHGSSHGETRITRRFVGEGPEYAPLVQRSHPLWRSLEHAPGELFAEVGCLTIGRQGGLARRHGGADFVAQTLEVAQSLGVAPELIAADELRRRYPQFVVPDDAIGILDTEAGFVRPERCIAAELAAARRAGAELRLGEAVRHVEPDGAALAVVTETGRHLADRVVLAAGAWTPGLVGPRIGARIEILPQAMHWFEVTEPSLWGEEASPVFLWFHGDGPSDFIYGIPPTRGGVPGVKLATEQYSERGSPEDADREVPEAESAAFFARHAAARVKGVGPRRLKAQRCLYSFNPPDGRFVIGPDPDLPGATVISACSGHGFKHSAALGEAVAETLVTGGSTIDLTPFLPRP